MLGIGKMVRAGGAVAAAAALAVPSAAEAQFDRTVQLCSSPLTYCANVGLRLISPSVLEVGIRNLGSTDMTTTSRITEFGLFGGNLASGSLVAQSYFDANLTDGTQTLAAGFATNGNGQDLTSGAGTTNVALGADFGNNGFLPIYVDDQVSGGFQRLSTDANEYGLFRFNVGALPGTMINISTIGVGLRVQSIGTSGASDKCFSNGIDANCTITNNPPGGINGGGVGSVVPEPSTYVLMGSGLLGLAGFARRRNRKS